MFELRWHRPAKGTEEYFHSTVPVGGAYMVLQYRQKDNWDAHDDDPDWGEWHNVEIVNE